MALGLSSEALARKCARRPWTTVGAWLLAVVIATILIVTLIGDALTTDIGPTSNPESEQAHDLLRERFFVPGRESTELVLVRSTGQTVEDPAFREFVEELFADISALGPELIINGTNFYQSGYETLVSLDRHTTALVFTLSVGNGNWEGYWDLFKARGRDQWQNPTGAPSSDDDQAAYQVKTVNANAGGEVVIVESSNLTVDDGEYRQFVEDLVFDVVSLGRPVIWGAAYYYATGDESLVSEDRHATIIPLSINSWDNIGRVQALIDDARRNSDFDINITGGATLDEDFNELSTHDLKEGELMFGLPMAIIVLVFVFAALVAAALPLVVAIVSIIIALGLAMLFAQALTISIFLTNMVFMMGLAVGIDYCLFIIARFREERARGREKHEAIGRAGATASSAVFFSGMTVVLALTSLMLVRHDLFISLGLGAILVVSVTIVASLTLLPALLGLLGDRVDRLRLPFFYRLQSRSGEQSGGMWDRISRAVMRAPAVSILLSGGLLVAAAIPVIDIDIGTAGVSTFPDRFESKKGYLALQENFPAGLAEPVVIVVDGPIDDPAVQEGISRLRGLLADDDAFGPVHEQVNPKRDMARLEVPVAFGEARSDAATAAVKRLRGEYIPAAFVDDSATVLVTGETAEVVDHVNLGNNGLVMVIPFVLVLSFVLLTVVFHSLVVPVKAVIMNLLSVGAAYGLMVLVFQKGIGNDLLGFQQTETIEWWVPSFLFAVLFGLSMDYHVFLLSRIRERFQETGDNAGSVAYGIRSTGRLITGAALIMVAVFVGFASGDLVMFQQMGFGLAVAVILDATIVRSVLVPASMRLLGRANWYLPSWLNWLPEYRAEG